MTISTFECEKCKDTGWIEANKMIRDGKEVDLKGARLQSIMKPCECVEVKRCKKILENSGIAEAFQSKTIRDYIPKSEQQAATKSMCIEYVKSFKEIKRSTENSIALLGQVGAGKSHLTIAVGNALLKSGIGVIYMQYREAVTQLKQLIRDEEEFQRALNRYKNAPVLIVDDLFKGMLRQGKANESDLGIIFDLINYRYLKKAPILVSSEYKLKDLVYFDEAIGSRIGEMAKGRIIEFEGKELNHRMR
jgi:DNA replication protein DnaC